MFDGKSQGNFNGMCNRMFNGLRTFTKNFNGKFNWNTDEKFKQESARTRDVCKTLTSRPF